MQELVFCFMNVAMPCLTSNLLNKVVSLVYLIFTSRLKDHNMLAAYGLASCV